MTYICDGVYKNMYLKICIQSKKRLYIFILQHYLMEMNKLWKLYTVRHCKKFGDVGTFEWEVL